MKQFVGVVWRWGVVDRGGGVGKRDIRRHLSSRACCAPLQRLQIRLAMSAVTFTDATVVSVEGYQYEAVLKHSDLCVMGGHRFVNFDKGNRYIIKWLTGGTVPTRRVNAVEAELVALRNSACEAAISAAPVPITSSMYKLFNQRRSVKEQVNSRANDIVDVVLPAFSYDGKAVGPVATKMPMRVKGELQLQLEPAVLYWFWARCQSIELGAPRASPKTAKFPPKEGIYYNKEKNGYVAKREADHVLGGSSKYKVFKVSEDATEIDAEAVAGEALSWSSTANIN